MVPNDAAFDMHDLDPRTLPTRRLRYPLAAYEKGYSDPSLRLPASLWHGSVLWRTIMRRPFNLQMKGFLPSYGKDRPFHPERLKEHFSFNQVIAPNCFALL